METSGGFFSASSELTARTVSDAERETRAAFVGRFQPLHEGHYRVIDEYRERVDLVVVIGSPNKSRTARNPLTADERERIIRACFDTVDVVRLPDEDRGEAGYPRWARRLVSVADADAVISQNDLVKRLVREHTSAEVIEQTVHSPDRFSGTEVRRRMAADEEWRSLVPDCCVDVVAEYEAVIRDAVADSA